MPGHDSGRVGQRVAHSIERQIEEGWLSMTLIEDAGGLPAIGVSACPGTVWGVPRGTPLPEILER
jgi:hypothetical protein